MNVSEILRRTLNKVLRAFYGVETDLSRRKEDWAELNKIDLVQFYKVKIHERMLYAQFTGINLTEALILRIQCQILMLNIVFSIAWIAVIFGK